MYATDLAAVRQQGSDSLGMLVVGMGGFESERNSSSGGFQVLQVYWSGNACTDRNKTTELGINVRLVSERLLSSPDTEFENAGLEAWTAVGRRGIIATGGVAALPSDSFCTVQFAVEYAQATDRYSKGQLIVSVNRCTLYDSVRVVARGPGGIGERFGRKGELPAWLDSSSRNLVLGAPVNMYTDETVPFRMNIRSLTNNDLGDSLWPYGGFESQTGVHMEVELVDGGSPVGAVVLYRYANDFDPDNDRYDISVELWEHGRRVGSCGVADGSKASHTNGPLHPRNEWPMFKGVAF